MPACAGPDAGGDSGAIGLHSLLMVRGSRGEPPRRLGFVELTKAGATHIMASKMNEARIVANIMAEARRLGWWVMKNHGSAYSVKGLPDLLAIKGGKSAWMEVKVPGAEPTKIQAHRMRELSGYGCLVAVVTSVQEARRFLQEMK